MTSVVKVKELQAKIITDLFGFSAPLVSDNDLNLKTFGLTVISGSDVCLNQCS